MEIARGCRRVRGIHRTAFRGGLDVDRGLVELRKIGWAWADGQREVCSDRRMAFTCDQCKAAITIGNIMVDGHNLDHERRVDAIEVWCKPCTRALDGHGAHAALHNLFELSEARDAPFALVAAIIDDLTTDAPLGHRWSRSAANRILRLCAEAHPTLTAGAYLDGEEGSE